MNNSFISGLKYTLALISFVLILSNCNKEEEKPNASPWVSITYPINNQNVAMGDDIAITTKVNDIDGNITKVDFYANDLLVGTTTNDPYSFVWNTSNESLGDCMVKAVISDSKGLTYTSKVGVKIVTPAEKIPKPDFTVDKTICAINESIKFTDKTLDEPTLLTWIFGDGGASNDTCPEYTYKNPGVYTVTLIASNKHGSDTLIKENYIVVGKSIVIDYDGNEYKTVVINGQEWFAENLKVTHFNDGTPIDKETGGSEWHNRTTPAYCWYDNKESYKEDYGALYNGYAVETGNLCPSGWQVPSDSIWNTLINYLGGSDIAGGKLKEAGQEHWLYLNTENTNDVGFSARGTGYRDRDGTFSRFGKDIYLWSSSQESQTTNYSINIAHGTNMVERSFSHKKDGFSIRCVKN